MSGGNGPEKSESDAPGVDPSEIRDLRQRLESEQNLLLGVVAGVLAAGAGAGIWAVITFATGYQIGFMAIGIGFLVGFAVRSLGQGVANSFGILGAVLALGGSALGNLLAITAIVADQQGVAFPSAVAQLRPSIIQQLMVAYFNTMDLVFYAIALYFAYRFSFRRVTDAQLAQLLSGGGGVEPD